MFKLNKKSMSYQETVRNMENGRLQFLNNDPNISADDRNVNTVTFQVTEDCNLNCTYCYQINKSPAKLSFDYAKRFIDLLIEDSYKDNTYFSLTKTSGIVIEFIGGEPLLEIELIDKIVDYFKVRLIEENHPWIEYFRISMISNGVLYFDDRVQNFIKKNNNILSFGISLDGCKELHDACRIFYNGEGSYDIAVKGCKHYMENYNENMYTKMTFAPENIKYTYKALVNLIELGYDIIHCNPVYEDKWDETHPSIYYSELKKVADYILDNNMCKDIDISVFDYNLFDKTDYKVDNKNYCGSTGHMLAVDPQGDIYPCVRFMKSSLGEKIAPFKIGNIFDGINVLPPDKKRVNLLDSITATSQSTDECINCPISKGCGWCTGYNYQTFGTVNKRATYICGMHKARSLANVYYWNKAYRKNNSNNRLKMNLGKEECLKIIDIDEYNILYKLQED